jgi:hypothetical protein
VDVEHQATDLRLLGRVLGCRLLGLEAGQEDVDAELELVSVEMRASSGQDEPARRP